MEIRKWSKKSKKEVTAMDKEIRTANRVYMAVVVFLTTAIVTGSIVLQHIRPGYLA